MRTIRLIVVAVLFLACSPTEELESENPDASATERADRAANTAKNTDTNTDTNATTETPPSSATRKETATGMPEGAVRVEKAEIIDRFGFEKPIRAATVLIPAGWKTEGGIAWPQSQPGCGKTTPHFAWRATSPDGLSAMEILGEESWSGNNLPMPGGPAQGCPNLWLGSAKEYIHAWLEHNRPGARVVEYRDRQDVVAELQKQLQQQQQPAVYGSEIRQWAEGGQVLIAYEDRGTPIREIIGISVVFNLMRMQGVMPGEIQEFLTLTTLPGFALRMPKERLDPRLAEMLRTSGRPDAQWQTRMAQHNAKIAQIQAQGAMERSRIIAQTGDEIREMQRESWEKRNASQDRMHREATETIRGTETYDDPYYGGTVELDNTYEHAWQPDDGSYILTDDASFDPFAVTGQSGRQLEVTP